MRAFRDIDIIFCRNVLIYFDQEARRKIVSNFYDALQDAGALVIGFSESLNGVSRLFQPAPWNKTVMYRKAIETVSVAHSSPTPADIQSAVPLRAKPGDVLSERVSSFSPKSSTVPTGVSDQRKIVGSSVGDGSRELKREPRWNR